MSRGWFGSKPIDGGHYIFNRPERDTFLHREPNAEKYLRPFVGSEEYINGGERWILCLDDAPPEELRRMPAVAERIAAVKKLRIESKSRPTRELADAPTRFHVTVIPNRPFLCIPKVSSERREYVPIGWLEPPIVPSDLVFVLQDADLWYFGILTSSMHMAWLRHIGGRLESRYRYSIGLVYNTFPWPVVTDAQKLKIRKLAQAVLDARAGYPHASLADLGLRGLPGASTKWWRRVVPLFSNTVCISMQALVILLTDFLLVKSTCEQLK